MSFRAPTGAWESSLHVFLLTCHPEPQVCHPELYKAKHRNEVRMTEPVCVGGAVSCLATFPEIYWFRGKCLVSHRISITFEHVIPSTPRVRGNPADFSIPLLLVFYFVHFLFLFSLRQKRKRKQNQKRKKSGARLAIVNIFRLNLPAICKWNRGRINCTSKYNNRYVEVTEPFRLIIGFRRYKRMKFVCK